MSTSTSIRLLAFVLLLSARPVFAQDAGLGTACDAPSDCASGNCVDGVCCRFSDCDDCGRCNAPAALGECRPQLNGHYNPACGGYFCDGTEQDCPQDCFKAGICKENFYCSDELTPTCESKLANSTPCTENEVCASGHCVDGVCCESACDGDCVACTGALRGDQGGNGECENVVNGAAGRQRCPAHPVNSCLTTGYCDGQGACAYHPEKTVCGQNRCAGNLQLTLACDGLGNCAPDISTECGGKCDGDGCRRIPCEMDGTCDAGAEPSPTCDGGQCEASTCDGGDCTPKQKLRCATDNECSGSLRCDFDGECVDPSTLMQTPSPCGVGPAGPAAARAGSTPSWLLIGMAGVTAWLARCALRGTRRRRRSTPDTGSEPRD